MFNVRKKIQTKKSVQSIRSPSILSELGDVNFGTLDATKDGLIVTYDNATDKFVLISPDQLLSISAEDNDIPDDFVTALENEINLGDIEIGNVDGGTF